MSDIVYDGHEGLEPPTPNPDEKNINPWDDESGNISQERSKKLDRQLRLWGIQGQIKIDKAHVLLLNASPVGCETLKNLVLPGIGTFSIVDGDNVCVRDLGINFYVTKEDLGKNRAEVCTANLLELNPDVKGNHINMSVSEMINSEDNFDEYNFVIASQMSFDDLKKLSYICMKKGIYMLVVRSYGMMGYMRTMGFSHCIVESKLDNPAEDLRMYDPWEILQKFASLNELEKMNEKDHCHTPYIVLLVQVVVEWKKSHNGKLPSGGKEVEEFKKLLLSKSRKSGTESNFIEATAKAFLAYREPSLSPDLESVLEDDNAKEENMDKDTPPFWLMVHAVRKFKENEGKGRLPLPGQVPDMHSDTDRFVRLQSLYRRKHRADVAAVKEYLKKICAKVGADQPTESYVSFFCRHVLNLRVVHYPSIEDELDCKKINSEAIQTEMYDETNPTILYLCLRAADEFAKKYKKYPGDKMDDDLDEEAKKLTKIISDLVKELGISDTPFNEEKSVFKYAREFARWGNGEVHTISSIVGGVASQEVIKLVTKQRLPMNNTWIYNGIDSKSVTLKL